MRFEYSYVDLLTAVYDLVTVDPIPNKEKEIILSLLYELEERLEKYSA